MAFIMQSQVGLADISLKTGMRTLGLPASRKHQRYESHNRLPWKPHLTGQLVLRGMRRKASSLRLMPTDIRRRAPANKNKNKNNPAESGTHPVPRSNDTTSHVENRNGVYGNLRLHTIAHEGGRKGHSIIEQVSDDVYLLIQIGSLQRDRRTANRDEATLRIPQSVPLLPPTQKHIKSATHDVVVLTAHRVRRTRLPATKADSRDGRTPEPELGGDALEVDPEQGEQR